MRLTTRPVAGKWKSEVEKRSGQVPAIALGTVEQLQKLIELARK